MSAGVCALHKSHSPVNLTVEFHHIIPVSWQLKWQPPLPWPHPGNDPSGRGQLWDARGVILCPTGHRNVHHDIVHMMGLYNDEGKMPTVESMTSTAGIAATALMRFAAAGGSLQVLCDEHEWGQS